MLSSPLLPPIAALLAMSVCFVCVFRLVFAVEGLQGRRQRSVKELARTRQELLAVQRECEALRAEAEKKLSEAEKDESWTAANEPALSEPLPRIYLGTEPVSERDMPFAARVRHAKRVGPKDAREWMEGWAAGRSYLVWAPDAAAARKRLEILFPTRDGFLIEEPSLSDL